LLVKFMIYRASSSTLIICWFKNYLNAIDRSDGASKIRFLVATNSLLPRRFKLQKKNESDIKKYNHILILVRDCIISKHVTNFKLV